MNQDIALITEYMDKVLEGGEITRDVKPTAFVGFWTKPKTAPVDTAIWHQKYEVLRLMRKHKILTKKISGKMKVPFSQIEAYLKGLRCPCKETQERIVATLDLLIINRGKDD